MSTDPESPQPLLELIAVRKSYVTGGEIETEVLKGLSLSIFPGEFVAIMGASGSGKSTLMNILGCLDRPTQGVYRFAGQDVATLDRDSLAWLRREAFGFVFQSYHLIATATATENVEVPAIYAGSTPLERRRRAQELLTSLGLGERLNHRPNQLSGGQQQRVSIARALMNGGRIILADEPTGALDSRSGTEVMALLKDLAARGHCVILITHDKEVARHAQRQIEIRDGEIVSDSSGLASADHESVAASRTPNSIYSQMQRPSGSVFAETGEAVKMACRALHANLFRTVLTLLGIVIGVGSVVAMLAIGEGAKQSVMERIGSMGTNLLLVRAGAPGQRGASGVATLIPADADAIAEVANVAAAVPESGGSVTVRHGNIDSPTTATATSPDYPFTRSWPVRQGTFFTQDDLDSYAAVTAIGQTVANNLFPDGTDPVGHFILVDSIPFLVIGVMEAKGATPWGQDADDAIFVPLSTGSLRLFGQQHVRSITVAVDALNQIDETQEAIRQVLLARHGVEDFQIRNMAAIVETASEASNTLTVLLGSIAAISLLVGGIGVMNIMLVSVTERTREIGIRMATGARTRDILLQFLTEAMVVSALGGVIGVAAGIGAGHGVAALGMPVEFTTGPMVLAFSCAALTGLIFGYAPAHKAAKLDPVVALASE
jgi:macrolide transport system ATP-binding/permease protein